MCNTAIIATAGVSASHVIFVGNTLGLSLHGHGVVSSVFGAVLGGRLHVKDMRG